MTPQNERAVLLLLFIAVLLVMGSYRMVYRWGELHQARRDQAACADDFVGCVAVLRAR